MKATFVLEDTHMSREFSFETLQLHAGQTPDRKQNHVLFQFTKPLHMFLTTLKKVKISLPLESLVISTHVLLIQQ